MMSNAVKKKRLTDQLESYNYFDSSKKLFSDLYLDKFLDILAKPIIDETLHFPVISI